MTLLRKTRLRPVSKRRSAQLRTYSEKRKAFLEAHPYCQWFLAVMGKTEADVRNGKIEAPAQGCVLIVRMAVPRSVDIHHKAGRVGAKLNDEAHWMAVSREGHDYIHQHPKEARAKGWLT